ncbi:MAG: hypothetical protein KGI08_07985, partial [Thaumarchaeota archaeon]|nr:hypothetical protein [Nitrososphaerota archaeon]
ETINRTQIKILSDAITLTESINVLKIHLLTIFEQITLVEKVISFLNNVLVSPFTDLYKKQSTSNSDLYDAQNTQYNDPDLYH